MERLRWVLLARRNRTLASAATPEDTHCSSTMRVVSDDVANIRSHPDFRIDRRVLMISRLAQVISERKVQGGLRRVLLTQAKRLQWLADRRYQALGGAASVEAENVENDDTN